MENVSHVRRTQSINMIPMIPNKSIRVILWPKISVNRMHFVLIVDRYHASYIEIE